MFFYLVVSTMAKWRLFFLQLFRIIRYVWRGRVLVSRAYLSKSFRPIIRVRTEEGCLTGFGKFIDDESTATLARAVWQQDAAERASASFTEDTLDGGMKRWPSRCVASDH